jgi:hypothetical protein
MPFFERLMESWVLKISLALWTIMALVIDWVLSCALVRAAFIAIAGDGLVLLGRFCAIQAA